MGKCLTRGTLLETTWEGYQEKLLTFGHYTVKSPGTEAQEPDAGEAAHSTLACPIQTPEQEGKGFPPEVCISLLPSTDKAGLIPASW